MPTIGLTDAEPRELTALLRKAIDEDRYPLSDRVRTWKAALAKLDPYAHCQPAMRR